MSPHEPRIPKSRQAPEPWDEFEQLPAGEDPAGQTHPGPVASSSPDDGPAPEAFGAAPKAFGTPGAVRTGTLGGPAGQGAGAAARPGEGAGAVEDPVAATAWEEEPPRVPVFRWRLVGSAVLVLVVAVAAWWAVTWLQRPSTPDPVPVDAQTPVQDGAEHPEAQPGTTPSDGGGGQAGGATGATDAGKAGRPTEAEGSGDPDGPGEAASAAPADGSDARVRVHVIGQVRSPGVVTVPAEARTADAIAAAGGTTGHARPERINLAAPLVDGQQVLVPGDDTTEEQLEAVQAQAHAVADPAGDQGAGEGGGPTAGAAGGEAGGGTAPAEAGDGAGGTEDRVAAGAGEDGTSGVDLNTADSTALQELPGVGPATAEKIIAHREQVGQFQSLADLDAVSGIGPATLERLAPLVTW